jgi:hypothetical protein
MTKTEKEKLTEYEDIKEDEELEEKIAKKKASEKETIKGNNGNEEITNELIETPKKDE